MTAAQPTIRASAAFASERLRGATPALLFGLRLWASVCLAFYVAFALELSEPSWAATTAALVCQPVLGASLRKALFRLIGTVIGAIAIVVLAALFRQDRVGFLVGLALWCAASAFVATLLRNFAAYAAALAGYTAAISRSTSSGRSAARAATSSSSPSTARSRSASALSARESCWRSPISATRGENSRRSSPPCRPRSWMGSPNALSPPAPALRFQALRRDLLRRVIALDPIIDAAIGEASDLRYRSPVLQRAVFGLMETISAWRKAAFEIARNRDAKRREEVAPFTTDCRASGPRPTRSTRRKGPRRCARRAARRRAPYALRCRDAVQRLLADTAAVGMLGMARALNGLTGVVDPRDVIRSRHGAFARRRLGARLRQRGCASF